MSTRQKKVATSKNLHLEKSDPKVEKHLHLNLMTTFHNFTCLFFTQYLFDASKIGEFWTLTVFY